MRPSSPLSLLLFIHLISATPVPNLRPDCQTSGTCRNEHTDNLKQRSSYPDLPVAALNSAFYKSSPQEQKPVKDLISAMDSSPKTISSSDATSVETVVFTVTQYPRKDWKTTYQQESLPDDSMHALPWTRVSWKDTRQDSDLLVVGIVVLFIIALIAWEAVGRLERLWITLRSSRRQRGPIFLSDDEERVIALRHHYTSDRAPSPEKRFSRMAKSHRWGEKSSCCSDDKNLPCTCSDPNKISTSALISKCVRGVCEL